VGRRVSNAPVRDPSKWVMELSHSKARCDELNLVSLRETGWDGEGFVMPIMLPRGESLHWSRMVYDGAMGRKPVSAKQRIA